MRKLTINTILILSTLTFAGCKENNLGDLMVEVICENPDNNESYFCNKDYYLEKLDNNETDSDNNETDSDDNKPSLDDNITNTIDFTNHSPTADEKNVTVESTASVNITLTATDKDNDNLTFKVVTSPMFGVLSGTGPNLTYTPEDTYKGSDFFEYTANDGKVDSEAAKVYITVTKVSTPSVTVSGKVTYDHVPVNSNNIGLDYGNITKKIAKEVLVTAIDEDDNTYASVSTDDKGEYKLDLPQNTKLKIRVFAKMVKLGSPYWNVKVVDNTSYNSVYVVDGSLNNTGTQDSTRNIHSDSGWGGNSYTSTRSAAPFAILDATYKSMQKILLADSKVSFPTLTINWSIKNKALFGSILNGDIGTTYYNDSNLYILGDEDSDTDEYDDHIIAHEWVHYYEDKFSRSDNIGGEHSHGEILDIRVAFSEGLGNAFSAMALDEPIYFDTNGDEQASGFNFNVESEAKLNEGWFSEASIQRILYDIYDSNDDGSDALSLGFTPMHKVFTTSQKSTPVFTSIFSFIHYLKVKNPNDDAKIDNIVESEAIATIVDVDGTGRTNRASELPTYKSLSVGTTVNICPSYSNGEDNKLGNRKYIKFTIDNSGEYTIAVTKSNNEASTDPDFILLNMASNLVALGDSADVDSEVQKIKLDNTDYLLDVSDFENISAACFDVKID